jgi:enoyl-CoA hydratase/carnithine racemase
VSDVVEISREDRVLRVALNRPGKKNALSAEVCRAVIDAVEQGAEDRRIGCLLLEARGDMFCAGMDLTEASSADAAELSVLHDRFFTLGARVAKPIVAAVSGPALGGGVGLIANAHIAIAAQGCSFGLTEIRVGMWPFLIWRAMVTAVGERRATALALTGRIFSANEALQWGLLHEIAPAFELQDRAIATAEHLANSAPQVIRLGLSFVRQMRDADSSESTRLAHAFRQEAFDGADFSEGTAAFREKRKPVWADISARDES